MNQPSLLHVLPDAVELYLAGQRVRLDLANQLGEAGGEGRAHKIGDTACKIYFPDKINDQKRAKLRVLQALRHSFPDNAATPMELLLDNQGVVQGYQMPLMPGKSIEELRDPNTRGTKEHVLGAIDVLIDLLTTLQTMHRARIIVGDLNPKNVLHTINPPHIGLIDIDSVQMFGYPCGVGVPTYVDPIVLRNFKRGIAIHDSFYSTDTDNYSFAVIAFESIMWSHPRKGIAQDQRIPDNTTAPGKNQWLLEGKWWVYSRGVIAPKCCRPPDWLDRELFEWFEAYFTTDQRPDPTSGLFERQLRKLGGRITIRSLTKPAIHPQLVNHNKLTGNKANVWGNANNLVGDCSRLRGDISGLSGVISIWGRVKNLRGNINRLRGDVSRIWGDCSNIYGDSTGLSGNVSHINGDVTNIRGHINVVGCISKLSGDISLLWGDLGSECRVWGDATGCQIDVSQHRGPIETLTLMLKEMGYYFGKPTQKRSPPRP